MDIVSTNTQQLELLQPFSCSALAGEKDLSWRKEMEERAQRGITEAQFSLGQYHFSQQRYTEAMKYFEMAKEGGSVQAQYQLGVMYYDGLGVPEDPAQGFSYMLQVAQSQKKKDSNVVPSAQYNVGRAYYQGYGILQSDSEAEKWWLLAAGWGGDASSVRAQNTLGMFYAREESRDLSKSFHWHLEAAENGNLESMAAVGMLYVEGQGCARDTERGLSWLKKSAEGGCVYGIGLLAHHYYTTKLFSKAAETAFKVSELEESSVQEGGSLSPLDCRGVAMGCFVLARSLQLGQVVSRNDFKAHEYFTKARKYDKIVVAELHDQLTHGQL